ncbi:MAG: hypothetical protein IKL53_09795, partial [Lachnospiraceae bacterium]|nr:hypothetical protein [Lachnospiraceae bacterium]
YLEVMPMIKVYLPYRKGHLFNGNPNVCSEAFQNRIGTSNSCIRNSIKNKNTLVFGRSECFVNKYL